MKSKLLQLKGHTWKCSVLGEQALLLELNTAENRLGVIHETVRLLEQSALQGVTDYVPAYQSIALIYDRMISEPEKEIDAIYQKVSGAEITFSPKTHVVPVCYELGLDWEEVEAHTSLSKEEIIQKHLHAKYKVAMMGFIPGFVYLEGMDESIYCPRKEIPRTSIPAGSVGIGGAQTGLYSLESPGGWQIIGRTPGSYFNPQQNPPTSVNPGDSVTFKRITESEFSKSKERLS